MQLPWFCRGNGVLRGGSVDGGLCQGARPRHQMERQQAGIQTLPPGERGLRDGRGARCSCWRSWTTPWREEPGSTLRSWVMDSQGMPATHAPT
ncbi:hypothetical protein FQN60_014588 [Etheostoma spectabile]|uniref:Uncharacterized protein n=1 Tax=Etheostoma spectabile TaxID=54343 RepID=A0A5J5DAV2_9PERO|nr:hypothetical protein FQN60_014588 [Etheostoma spectabile]